jgi:RNA polymerase sigma-70 factor (ECF subfamily)
MPAVISPERWSDLVCQIADRNEAALEQLYEETKGIIFGCALRILGDGGAAEEVTLDVYLKVWNQADTFRLERGSALTWMVVMTRSKALDYLRRESSRRSEWVEVEDLMASRDHSPDSAAEAQLLAHKVKAMLAQMPEAQRTALEMAFFDGLTHSEIAQKLNEPLGTVKTRIRSALMTLRRSLTRSSTT